MRSGQLHFDILSHERQALLPLLSPLKSRFYLAGGTALALQKGHRDSIDFDFFTDQPFNPTQLQQEMASLLESHTVTVTQAAPNTLGSLVDSTIRLSFMTYQYPLIEPLLDSPSLKLASVLDIGCMKLSAIISRSTLKDYVDLYTILQDVNLDTLLKATQQKFPSVDPNVMLKALVYFDDVQEEPIAFQPGFAVERTTIETFLQTKVRETIAG